MADDIRISIGADSSTLQAQMDITAAQIRVTTKAIRDMADGAIALGAATDSGIISRLGTLNATLDGVKSKMDALKASISEVATASAGAGGIQEFINQTNGLDRNFQSARSSAATFASALATQGATAAEAAVANAAIGASVRTLAASDFGALVASLATQRQSFASAKESASVFEAALGDVGGSVATLSGSQFGALIRNTESAGLSFKSARESAAVFGAETITVIEGMTQAGIAARNVASAREAMDVVARGMSSAGAAASAMAIATATIPSAVNSAASAARAGMVGMGGLVRSLHAVTDEALSGRWGQMYGSLANLAYQARGIGVAFLASNAGLLSLSAGFLTAAGAAAYFSYKAQEAKNNINGLLVQSNSTGNANNSFGSAKSDFDVVNKLPDQSSDSANKFTAAVLKMNDAGNLLGSGLSHSIQTVADMMHSDIPAATDAMSAAFTKPATAGLALIDSLGGVTAAESNMMAAAAASGNQQQQLAIFVGALARVTEQAAEAHKDLTAVHTSGLEKFIDSINVFKSLGLSAGIAGNATGKFTDEAHKTAGELDAAADAARKLAPSLQQVVAAANSIAVKDNPLSAQLQENIDKANTLRTALQRIGQAGGGANQMGSTAETGDATSMIKGFEGFQPQAKWDVNHFRAGYGSDTTTDKSGGVHNVTADTTTTEEDAQRDLSRRVAESATAAATQVGEAWAKLSDQAKASLTSIQYNYGHLPSDVASAARTGSDTGISSSILAHTGDNGGVNASRRQQEAANVTSGASTNNINDALADTQDQQQKINESIKTQNDLRAGGSATQLAELALAKQNAEAAVAPVEAARQKAAASQTYLVELQAAGASQATINKAQEQASNDQAALNEKIYESRKAIADLAVTSVKTGSNDPKQLRDAQIASANLTLQQYSDKRDPRNSAAQGQVKTAQDTYEGATAKTATDTEDVSFNAAQKASEEKMALIREETKTKQLSQQQGASQETAVLQQELAQEQAHYQSLMTIWGQGTTQFDAAQKKMQESAAQSALQINKVNLQSAQAIAESYEKAFEKAGSTAASAFVGIVNHTETAGSALKGIATSIESSFVQAAAKMVADWLAKQAIMVMATTTGEATKTAAVASGTAARTASEGAGAATSAAVTIASITKSIMASAGETFAGIFGFLSPVMGPAAIGPAAAGEATVAAAAGSFAVGAWKLPSDMIAQVHKGEMIVPASHADSMRSALSGGGGGSSGGGHTVHVHYNAAPGSSLDTIRAHGREIAKMVGDQFSKNPSLRPSGY
jgi:hypothetical protein